MYAQNGHRIGNLRWVPLSWGENILLYLAGNRTQVAGSIGKDSTTSL